MELWSRSVWIELESRTFSEVYGCVWVLWEMILFLRQSLRLSCEASEMVGVMWALRWALSLADAEV